MLAIYQKQFNEIMTETTGRKQTMLLANLMSQMECYYKLSMIKEVFERETDNEVKRLYLNVSNARNL